MENKTEKKPSVTELLSLLDKPALLGWANRQGLLGVDISKARKKWLFDGTSLHKQIERFHKDGEAFDRDTDQENYLRFMEGKTILELELPIETEYFQGRLDCLLESDGNRILIDFKKKTKGRVYLENILQLVAYGMAVECHSFAIVAIPSFEMIKVDIGDRKPYEDIIKALSVIYNSKKLIEKI